MNSALSAVSRGLRRLSEARPSPAMGVALAALVVAMSGTAIATSQLGKNSVGSGNIRPGAVAYPDLRKGAVRGSKLGKEGIAADKLAEGAITGPALRDGVVGEAKLSDEAVSSRKLALGAVLAANLGTGSVLNDKIARGAVDGESVADGSLGTDDFSGGIPAVRVTATQNQDLPSEQNNVALAFDSEVLDTRNMHTTSGADNTKLVAPVDGVYIITGFVFWSSKDNAQGIRTIHIDRNRDDEGAFSLATDARSIDTYEASVEVPSQSVSSIAFLEAGDYVELRVFQETTLFPAETHPTIHSEAGGTAESAPELSMVWIAPGP
jgi:hypothetical protein